MDSISHIQSPSVDPVTALVEEAAIRKLEHYYVICVDARRFKELSNVFVEDVVADYGPGVGVLNGVQTLAGALEQMTAPVLAQHSITTQLITLEAPTDGKTLRKATAVTYVIASQFGKGAKEGIPLYAYPRYEDKLVKDTTGWKITHRTLSYMGPHTGDISIFGI